MAQHNISFRKVTTTDLKQIYHWLDASHMQAFWDNTPEHRDDIKRFAKTQSHATSHDGIFTYWLGIVNNYEPYSMIMTSEFAPLESVPKVYRSYIASSGRTFGLDFCIGNTDYLGKKLAAPTLSQFMDFFCNHVESDISRFLIDPASNNLKAIHVYEKAGFITQGEFIQDSGPFKGIKHLLMAKTINDKG